MGSVEPIEGDGQQVWKDFELTTRLCFQSIHNGNFLYPLKRKLRNQVPVGRTCGEYCKESIINDIIREG